MASLVSVLISECSDLLVERSDVLKKSQAKLSYYPLNINLVQIKLGSSQ